MICNQILVLSLPALATEWAANTNALAIADLQKAISEHGRLIRSFELQGTVCAVVPESKVIVLQDQTATALLEVPEVPKTLSVGDRIAIEGEHCMLVRSHFGIRMGSTLVLDNQSTPGHVISGSVYLTPGRQPFHLKWFRLARGELDSEQLPSGHEIRVGVDWIPATSSGSVLSLQYEGPGIPLQTIPSSLLWRQHPGIGQAGFEQGLLYTAFRGKDFGSTSGFDDASKVGEGTRFSLR